MEHVMDRVIERLNKAHRDEIATLKARCAELESHPAGGELVEVVKKALEWLSHPSRCRHMRNCNLILLAEAFAPDDDEECDCGFSDIKNGLSAALQTKEAQGGEPKSMGEYLKLGDTEKMKLHQPQATEGETSATLNRISTNPESDHEAL